MEKSSGGYTGFRNKKRKIFLIFLAVFSLIFVSNSVFAADINDTLHLNLQTTYANGTIQTGTFDFAFNITESSDASCLGPVVYNYTVQKTTDSRGIVSIYLPTTGDAGNLSQLDFNTQYYVCYSRDGSLKSVSQLGRVPYAFTVPSINLSKITVDSNLDLNASGYNVTASHGFFGSLGSLVNRITDFFAINADLSGNLTVGNNLSVSGGAFFVDNNTGRVGVGTTSPGEALDVVGTVQATGPFQTTGNEILYAGSTLGQVKFYRPASTDSIALYAGGSERLRVGENGSIGINVTNPQNTLNVIGTLNITNVTGTVGLYQDSNGWVGIGVSSPSQVLDVNGGIQIGNTNSAEAGAIRWTGSEFQAYNGTDWNSFGASGSGSYWSKNGTSVYYTLGSVGIGTGNPQEALDVVGTVQATGPFQTTGNEILYAGSTLGQVKFYRPASTDSIALYAGGLERVRVDENGNFGVNATAPNSTLHVIGDANITGTVYAQGEKNLSIGYDYSTNGTYYLNTNPFGFYNSTTLNNVSQLSNDNSYYNSTTLQNVSQLSNDNGYYNSSTIGDIVNTSYYVPYTGATQSVDIGANNLTIDTNTLFVDSNSNQVGIGTSTPASGYKLHVAGTVKTAGVNIGTSTSNYHIEGVSNGNISINSESSGNVLLANGGGKVGIGTTSPRQLLSLADDSEAVLGFQNTTGSENAYIGGSADATGGKLRFFTKNTTGSLNEVVRIKNNGNVGIGESNPSYKLQVSGGDISIDNNQYYRAKDTGGTSRTIAYLSNANVLTLQNNALGTGGDINLYTGSTATQGLYIKNGGNVGIGTTNPSRAGLNVYDGTAPFIHLTNPTTGDTASDGSYMTQTGLNTLIGNQETANLTLFVDNDANRGIFIRSGGNIGIGTTSPNSLLDVQGTSAKFILNSTSGAGDIEILTSSATTDPRIIFSPNQSSAFTIGVDSSDANKFKIGEGAGDLTTDTKLTIDSLGNVGINTSNPQNKLNVVSGGSSTYFANFSASTGGGSISIYQNSNNHPNIYGANSAGTVNFVLNTGGFSYLQGGNFKVGGSADNGNTFQVSGNTSLQGNLSVDSTTLFVDSNSDAVGIGTASPNGLRSSNGVKLALESIQNPEITLNRTTSGDEGSASFRINDNQDLVVAVQNGTNASLALDAITVLSDTGYLGINTSSPGRLLDVRGIVGWENATGTELGILSGVDGTGFVQVNNNGGAVIQLVGAGNSYLNTNGNFGVNTSSPQNTLNVVGDINATGTIYAQGTKNLSIAYDYVTNGSIASNDSYLLNTGDTAEGNYTFDSGTFFVNANDNRVGIGTTSPSGKLDVRGDSGNIIFAKGFIGQTAAEEYLKIQDSSAGAVLDVRGDGKVGIGTASPSTRLDVVDTTASEGWIANFTRNSQSFGIYSGTNRITLGTVTDQDLGFFTGSGSPIIFLNHSSQNVGIGTTSPSYALDVAGASTTNIRVDAGGAGDANVRFSNDGTTRWVVGNDESDSSFKITSNTYSDAEFTINGSSGKVGIGTISPAATLHISSATPGVRLTDTTGSQILDIYQANADSTINNNAEGYLRFSTNNTERVRIASDGKVGIGTTTLKEKFQVNGNILLTGSNGVRSNLFYNGSWNYLGTGYGHALTFNKDDATIYFAGTSAAGTADASATVANIAVINTSSGKVGIGTSSPSDKLTIGTGTTSPGFTTDPDIAATVSSTTDGDEVAYQLYSNEGVNDRRLKLFLDDTTGISGIDVSAASSVTDFQFQRAGSAVLTIKGDGTGYVGIGTTSPSSRLNVLGNDTSAVALRIDNQDTTTGVSRLHFNTNSHDNALSVNQAGDFIFASDGAIGSGGTSGDFVTKAVLLDNGNFGIGITSPQTPLHVNGSIRTERDYGSFGFYVSGTGDRSSISSNTNNDFVFNTPSSSEKVVVYNNAAGPRLGVNVSSPDYTLDINGQAKFRNFILRNANSQAVVSNVEGTSGYTKLLAPEENGYIQFFTNGSSSGDERVRIDSSGKVGINTTTPATTLNVFNGLNSGEKFRISQSGSNYMSFSEHEIEVSRVSGSTGNFELRTIANAWGAGGGGILFSTNGTQRGVIDVSGNFGIGTASPKNNLQVGAGTDSAFQSYDGILVNTVNEPAQISVRNNNSGTSTEAGIFTHTNGNAYVGSWTNSPLIFRTNNVDRLAVDTTGYVGINTTSPQQTLNVVGTFNATQNGGSLEVDSSGDVRIGI